ncbi:CYTH domain-containing protein [Lyngbya confervoides]|uniref:CYTH domain-containing protein n=1 Tax=Lyngbya confervoides BDU141951 TaxID=1574623 RepID=A0ABD4T3E0_9CYAN|nr:CYTH domain-containing protein [Lyngbya confervoides]MCM1983193.1 CYTH domain-containing protein [Lyngbya confervoides BDU141951]
MGIEIERKFLVAGDAWKHQASGVRYRQGYLTRSPAVTVRIRLVGEVGYLTVKGPVVNLTRPEYEYEIPGEDARQMLRHWCRDQIIEKNRYRIPFAGLIWEVDEFLGPNQGLILAEVELSDPAQPVDLPSWVDQEVSGDNRYYNSYLVQHPYTTWNRP